VTLELNYRSTQPILDGANGVIGLARERFTKNLVAARPGLARPRLVEVADDGAQVDHVVGRILELREAGVPLLQQAVLFRTAHHSNALEVELVRRNIPFVKWGGLKFLEAAHVKDVMAMLRWAENPRDRVAAFRTLQLLPGIGPGIARRMLGSLEASGPAGLDRLVPPPAARHLWTSFAATMQSLVEQPAWPGDLERVRAFYDPLLPDLHENPAVRLLDLDQLLSIALRSPGRERFLTDLTLDPPEAVGDEAGTPLRDEEQLVLSTIHSAKGQEWKAVFVLNCVDGCIPSDMATGSEAEIEEERRLLYVAMTRAKDELDLMVPQRFFVLLQRPRGDRHLRANRSRFIPDRLLPLFERMRGGPPGESAREGKSPLPRLDLRADLAGMWD
jgi:DNA helicase-2/ATP-dependent DNA helicase PcrA